MVITTKSPYNPTVNAAIHLLLETLLGTQKQTCTDKDFTSHCYVTTAIYIVAHLIKISPDYIQVICQSLEVVKGLLSAQVASAQNVLNLPWYLEERRKK